MLKRYTDFHIIFRGYLYLHLVDIYSSFIELLGYDICCRFEFCSVSKDF